MDMTPFRLTFKDEEIANWAKAHVGTPNRFGGRSGSGSLDAVGHLMAVAACLCQPIEVDAGWCRDGGPLPLAEIPLAQATVGDVLVFDMLGARGWGEAWPWGVGIMTRGETVDSDDAQVCHARHGHACTLTWLKPLFRKHLVRAHRFARRV